MEVLLSVSIAMLAALLFTRVFKKIKLPNVTAYLVAGVIIGPYVLKLVNNDSLEVLNMVTVIALGFIAFSIGAEFKIEHIKKLGSKILIITAFQALMATFLVDLVLILLGFDKAEAIALGAIATATAPAATILVIRQYKAKGELTSTLLPVVAMDDALGLIVYAVSISIARMFKENVTFDIMHTLVLPVGEIILSIVIGSVLGAIVAILHRFFRSNANRLSICIAFVFLGVYIAKVYNLSDLLLCMSIGAIFVNLREDFQGTLDVVDSWTPPLFMLFFVISGAELKLDVLSTVGLLGVTYIIVRSIGKYLGAYLGSVIVKAPDSVRKYLGITLLPQAGVAIGMAQLTLTQLPSIGDKIQAVVLFATLVYELVGPFMTKEALIKAGEVERENK